MYSSSSSSKRTKNDTLINTPSADLYDHTDDGEDEMDKLMNSLRKTNINNSNNYNKRINHDNNPNKQNPNAPSFKNKKLEHESKQQDTPIISDNSKYAKMITTPAVSKFLLENGLYEPNGNGKNGNYVFFKMSELITNSDVNQWVSYDRFKRIMVVNVGLGYQDFEYKTIKQDLIKFLDKIHEIFGREKITAVVSTLVVVIPFNIIDILPAFFVVPVFNPVLLKFGVTINYYEDEYNNNQVQINSTIAKKLVEFNEMLEHSFILRALFNVQKWTQYDEVVTETKLGEVQIQYTCHNNLLKLNRILSPTGSLGFIEDKDIVDLFNQSLSFKMQ